jgi:hypothetical protein
MANKDKATQEMTVTQQSISAALDLLGAVHMQIEDLYNGLGGIADGDATEYDSDDRPVPASDEDRVAAQTAHDALYSLAEEIDNAISAMQPDITGATSEQSQYDAYGYPVAQK